MVINALLVEDNPYKNSNIMDFISSTWLHDIDIREARSFTSACQLLDKEKFDFVILDISLPTYDKTDNEAGGRFRPFAGREIARKLVRRGAEEKIIFVTQYTSFSERGSSHSLETLSELLRRDCESNFSDLIFFDSARLTWKTKLKAAIDKIIYSK